MRTPWSRALDGLRADATEVAGRATVVLERMLISTAVVALAVGIVTGVMLALVAGMAVRL